MGSTLLTVNNPSPSRSLLIDDFDRDESITTTFFGGSTNSKGFITGDLADDTSVEGFVGFLSKATDGVSSQMTNKFFIPQGDPTDPSYR